MHHYRPIFELFNQADKLHKTFINLPDNTEGQKAIKQQARQELHDFLLANPQMGPDRYKKYLEKDGPDLVVEQPRPRASAANG